MMNIVRGFLDFFDVCNRLIRARKLCLGTSPSTPLPCVRLEQRSARMRRTEQFRKSFQSEGEVGEFVEGGWSRRR